VHRAVDLGPDSATDLGPTDCELGNVRSIRMESSGPTGIGNLGPKTRVGRTCVTGDGDGTTVGTC
jgi:hypothetical protein